MLNNQLICMREFNLIMNKILQWPIEKTRLVIWDALHDYDRIKWKRILADLEKAMEVAYQDVLYEFDSTWVVKGLIMTYSNLVVTWKVRPHMGIISSSLFGVHYFSEAVVLWFPYNLFLTQKKKIIIMNKIFI